MKKDIYDPSEDDDQPWCVRVLGRRPIELDDAMSDEALASELAERLEALLEANFCDATPEGWQKLAIALALQYEPGLKINTPADRPPGKGGREPDPSSWGHLLMLNQEIRALKGCRDQARGKQASGHGRSPKARRKSQKRAKRRAPSEYIIRIQAGYISLPSFYGTPAMGAAD